MRVLITVLCLAACAATSTDESTGEYIDDAAITTKVKTALLQDPEVSGLDINVETFKGTVQLSGFANTERERQRAGTLARLVEGVQSIQNDIELKQAQ
ncbi:MAG TPA: BON domain-containing protein [Gammaproteobacteria bacterium]|nr:BON domain-containing protein [Gammaproteobacteria bacterium]